MNPFRSTALALTGATLLIGVTAWANLLGPNGDPVPRDQLWQAVQGCVAAAGTPAFTGQCVQIDLSQGFAKGTVLLKDRRGASHFLLLPTIAVSGIEDPTLLSPGRPDYWNAAWRERFHIQAILGKPVPDYAVGLAANPPFARSQDQLHIHMDCARADVVERLDQLREAIDDAWSRTPVILNGAPYRVRFVREDGIGEIDPFKVLAANLDIPNDRMDLHTLIVLRPRFPEKRRRGFYLIEGHRAPDDTTTRVHGEDLLDADCQILP